jgi:hypothetical protein
MGGVDADRQGREKLKHEFVDLGEADVSHPELCELLSGKPKWRFQMRAASHSRSILVKRYAGNCLCDTFGPKIASFERRSRAWL